MLKIVLLGLTTIIKGLMLPFADSGQLSKQGIHKINMPNNEEVAVWWDFKKQKWNAVNDVCPHRHASLSNGVITPEGNIKCPYHGIEFNGCGNCKMIPCSGTTNKDSFFVKNFNIKEKYGLLWITDKGFHSKILDFDILENKHSKIDWTINEQDLDHTIVIENALDISHIDHLHHGVLPRLERYDPSVSFDNIELTQFDRYGFSIDVLKNGVSILKVSYKKIDNLCNVIEWTYENVVTIFAIVMPLGYKKTRAIATLVNPSKSLFHKKLTDFLIVFLKHPIKHYINVITNQDKNLLYNQQKNIEKYGKHYIQNGLSDKPIALFNAWNRRYASNTYNTDCEEECEL